MMSATNSPTSSERKSGVGHPAVLVGFLALAMGISYFYAGSVLYPGRAMALPLHRQVLAGTAPSPYAYRVLAPWTIEAVSRAAGALFGLPAQNAFLFAEVVWSTLAIWCSLAALGWLLGRWWGPLGTATGAVLGTFSMNMALRDHYYQPWSLIEPALFALGYWAIRRDRFATLIILVAVGTINRETACFLVLLYVMYWWPLGRDRAIRAGKLCLSWLAVFLTVRAVVGAKPFVNELWQVLALNVQPAWLAHTGAAWLMFLGPFWYFFWRGIPLLDGRSRRAMLCLLAFGAVLFIEGYWWETRPWMSFYCVLFPPVCAFFESVLAHSSIGAGIMTDRALTSARSMAATARELFSASPFLQRLAQQWRPYICPFERLMAHVPRQAMVLDVGCGAGLFLGLLAWNGYEIQGVGCDVSERAIAQAQRVALRVKSAGRPGSLAFFCVNRGGDIPLGPFDVVATIDVLHHIEPSRQREFFRSAALRVKPGGILLYKDMCCRPWWRATANRVHDLLAAREAIHYVCISNVERWALEDGLRLEVADYLTRFWYGHELRVFRRMP